VRSSRHRSGARAAVVAVVLLAAFGCARRRARVPRPPATAAPSPPAAAAPPAERCGRCPDGAALEVRHASLVAGRRGTGRLRLEAVLPAPQFAEANPLVDDVRIAVRDDGGELVCATVEHEYWTRKHGVYRFEDRVLDPRRRRAVGLRDGVLAPRADGAAVLRARGDRFDVARAPRGRATVVVWVGDRCAAGAVAAGSAAPRS